MKFVDIFTLGCLDCPLVPAEITRIPTPLFFSFPPFSFMGFLSLATRVSLCLSICNECINWFFHLFGFLGYHFIWAVTRKRKKEKKEKKAETMKELGLLMWDLQFLSPSNARASD